MWKNLNKRQRRDIAILIVVLLFFSAVFAGFAALPKFFAALPEFNGYVAIEAMANGLLALAAVWVVISVIANEPPESTEATVSEGPLHHEPEAQVISTSSRYGSVRSTVFKATRAVDRWFGKDSEEDIARIASVEARRIIDMDRAAAEEVRKRQATASQTQAAMVCIGGLAVAVSSATKLFQALIN